MEQIAVELGITPQRVWQILNPEKWGAYLNNERNYQKKLERARKRYATKRVAGMTREEIIAPKQKNRTALPVKTRRPSANLREEERNQ